MPQTPRPLAFIPQTVVDAPFLALENAFWRPQAAKLFGKHKETLKSIPKEQAEKTYQKLRVAWLKEETWVNHALGALLAALPPAVLSDVMGAFVGSVRLRKPTTARLDAAGISSITGAPDFVALDNRTCILGESKVAVRPRGHGYSFQQFTKYMLLGAITQCARSPEMAREAAHLIVVPDADPEKFCDDYAHWKPSVVGRQLLVSGRDLRPKDGTKGHVRDFETWRRHLRATLLGDKVRARCDIDPMKVDELLERAVPTVIPTFVATWEELMRAVRVACDKHGAANLQAAATRLEEMALGKALPHQY